MHKPRNDKTIDGYIHSFPPDVRGKLTQLRRLVKQIAPGAVERISYRIPAFFLNGVLVWFAAHSNHIGFYPKASAVARFRKELVKYKHAKGSVRFPLDEPLPLDLIRRIVRFRVAENSRLAKKRAR